MVAIKCPICGSGQCEKITDTEYMCLACDTRFNRSDLSKEFQKTDEHITSMHEDLSRKIDKLSGGENSNEAYCKEILFHANEALEQEDMLEAYVQFKKYAAMVPESCEGYLGMYRAVTEDFAISDCVAEDATLDDGFGELLNGFDVLKKAYECEDCDREELLSQTLDCYRESALEKIANILKKEDSELSSKFGIEKENLPQRLEEAISELENKIDQKEKIVLRIEKFNIIKFAIKEQILAAAVVASILIWACTSGILGWGIKILDLAAFFLMAVRYISDIYEMYISNSKRKIEFCNEYIKYYDEIDSLDEEDIEAMILDDWEDGYTAQEMYEWMIEDQKDEEERKKGFYQIRIENWSNNPSRVYVCLKDNTGVDKEWLMQQCNNRAATRITGFRESEAHRLQEELIDIGASVYVDKM